MMENKDYNTAQRLLMMADQESPSEIQSHTQENIIPPIGIARPELIESFMENIGDEEKIKRDIDDITNYYNENPLETTEREVKSHGLRALEGLGGTLGSFLNALSGEAYFDESGELTKNKVPMMPSAKQLREFTKEKTGKKFEPKSKLAKSTQEAIIDVGSNLPLPGGWFFKLVNPFLGEGLKELSKHQGASENTSDLIKQGYLVTSTIANIGNAPQMARNAYNQVTQMMPQGTRMPTRIIENTLNTIRNKPWFRTGRTTSKGPAMDEINRIEQSIQYGSMDVHDAMQIRRDINEARKKLGAFHYEPGMDKAAARRYLDEVDEAMRQGMQDFGNRQFPEWYNAYERANQAYGITRRSLQLQDYIKEHSLGRALQSQTAKTLFHLGGASAITQAPSLLLGAAPIAAGAKGIQVMNRMIRSPLLRNYYLEVLSAAASQNAGAMNRALDKFDKEAKKLEKNQ